MQHVRAFNQQHQHQGPQTSAWHYTSPPKLACDQVAWHSAPLHAGQCFLFCSAHREAAWVRRAQPVKHLITEPVREVTPQRHVFCQQDAACRALWSALNVEQLKAPHPCTSNASTVGKVGGASNQQCHDSELFSSSKIIILMRLLVIALCTSSRHHQANPMPQGQALALPSPREPGPSTHTCILGGQLRWLSLVTTVLLGLAWDGQHKFRPVAGGNGCSTPLAISVSLG